MPIGRNVALSIDSIFMAMTIISIIDKFGACEFQGLDGLILKIFA